jgi:hypothetical protein
MFEPQTYALMMLAAFFVMLMIGVPVATTLATVGFVFGYLGFGDSLFSLLPARVYGIVAGYQWMSIPLFVFMGVMLEKSRLADDLLDVMGHLAGGLRGGMGVGIILFGVLMGATTGIVGATVITLGLLVLMTQATGNRERYDASYEWLVLTNTVVATGLGRARRAPVLVPNPVAVQRTGTYNEPVSAVDASPGANQQFDAIRTPAVWRRESASETVRAMERNGTETYDIPAFLRRQVVALCCICCIPLVALWLYCFLQIHPFLRQPHQLLLKSFLNTFLLFRI